MTLPSFPIPDDPVAAEIATVSTELRLAERSAELDRTGEFPRREFRELGRRRLLGLHVDPSLGGRGWPLLRVGIALFHLARAGGTTFAKLSLQPEFSSVLAEHGTTELVDRYYRPLMRGELLVANHVTEPGAGSDLRGITTSATPADAGFVLEGTKSEAAFATDADAAIVYARVPGAAGLTAFLVPQDLPGVSRRRIPDLGERWMGRGTVDYRAVPVPPDHRIGDEGKALEYVRQELVRERALLACIYLGVGRASWEETVEHVGRREAFGSSLAAQQAVSLPLVDDWARLDASWLYVERVLRRADDGEEVSAESGIAKSMATDAALTAIDHAVQFHGGAGYSAALPHERRWRDVRSGRIAHGPSELLLDRAAGRLWPGRRSRRVPVPVPGA